MLKPGIEQEHDGQIIPDSYGTNHKRAETSERSLRNLLRGENIQWRIPKGSGPAPVITSSHLSQRLASHMERRGGKTKAASLTWPSQCPTVVTSQHFAQPAHCCSEHNLCSSPKRFLFPFAYEFNTGWDWIRAAKKKKIRKKRKEGRKKKRKRKIYGRYGDRYYTKLKTSGINTPPALLPGEPPPVWLVREGVLGLPFWRVEPGVSCLSSKPAGRKGRPGKQVEAGARATQPGSLYDQCIPACWWWPLTTAES